MEIRASEFPANFISVITGQCRDARRIPEGSRSRTILNKHVDECGACARRIKDYVIRQSEEYPVPS